MASMKAALASAILLAGKAAALDPIIMSGSKFFWENGTQFFIRGVAYQADSAEAGQETSGGGTYVDPLANKTICERDVPLLAALGTNVIRTYSIDPTMDHSDCMSLLSDAGIYVISDLSEPDLSINRDDPTWDVDLYERYISVIDELGQYDNVIGFFAGNEVTNNASNTEASAYVKAAVRDTKAYIAEKEAAGGRWMGVGYAANDDEAIRHNLADYFNCGNTSEAIDFFGYNIYSWCGDSSYTESGYDTETAFFANYSVPVFFAEYGCNTVGGAEGRLWDDTTALYGDEMTPVFSGGIVYMYFEETNDYGIVTVSDGAATTMTNYGVLSSKLAAATPSSTSSADYTPTNVAQSCPAIANDWQANEVLPPTPSRELCDCMYESLTCKPATGLSEDDYATIFNYICGADSAACDSIIADEATGVYGPYVGCNSTHQLGAVLDAYYKDQDSASTACDFDGMAVTATGSENATCSALISAASASAKSAASATAGSSSSTSSSNPAPALRVQTAASFGSWAIAFNVLAALFAGIFLL
ncbi:1,3-beta-glucanosyltransferase-like protein [Xylariales sp. PMI_506]|nr:1,3-beta-glucanosyltransferase-like protein [Xylariales sp. PMI_506]